MSLEKAGISDTESTARAEKHQQTPILHVGPAGRGGALVQPIARAVQNACDVFTCAEKPLFSKIA